MTAASIAQAGSREFQKVWAGLIDSVNNIIDKSNPLPVVSNFVPGTYNKQTASSGKFSIQKGELNKLRIRQQILNEHCESSKDVQGVVTSSLIVGQIFKASQDNINGINLTMESAAAVSMDDFESYADSAALQVAWVETTNPALLETTIVNEGTQSMDLPLDANNDEWVKTVSSTNYTDYTFNFDYNQTVISGGGGATVRFWIGDGTNTKSLNIVVPAANDWNNISINENAMADDGGTTPVMTAITKIGFRVTTRKVNAEAYVDALTATPSPGTVELKLWNMGTTIPTTAVTSIDDGTQYTKLGDAGISGLQEASVILQLIGGKRMYNLDAFVAGVALEIPTNEILIPGNYYALTINYVDTNVSVYGPAVSFATNYYVNGYSFTAPDEATAITKLGTYNDCMFMIFSTQDAYITNIGQIADAEPNGDSLSSMYVEDENMKVTDIGLTGAQGNKITTIDLISIPMFMSKGSKFEQYYNDDATDSVTTITLGFRYRYIPPTTNG